MLIPVLKLLERKFKEIHEDKSHWPAFVSIRKGILESEGELTPDALDEWIAQQINNDKHLIVSFLDQIDADNHDLTEFVLEFIPKLGMNAMDKGMPVMFGCTRTAYYKRILSNLNHVEHAKSVVLLLKYFVTNETFMCRTITESVTIPLHKGFHGVSGEKAKSYDEEVFKVYFDIITFLVNNDIGYRVCNGRVVECDMLKGASEMLWTKWCETRKPGVIAQDNNLFVIMEQFLADFLTFSFNPARCDFLFEVEEYRESLESVIPILSTVCLSDSKSADNSKSTFKDNSDLVNLVKSVNLLLAQQDVNDALYKYLENDSIGLKMILKLAKNCHDIKVFVSLLFGLLTSTTAAVSKRPGVRVGRGRGKNTCPGVGAGNCRPGSLFFGAPARGQGRDWKDTLPAPGIHGTGNPSRFPSAVSMNTELKYKALILIVEFNLDRALKLVDLSGKMTDGNREVIVKNLKIVLDYLNLFSSSPKSLPVTVEEVFYQAYIILKLRCEHEEVVSGVFDIFKVYLEYYEADLSILSGFIGAAGLVRNNGDYICELINMCLLNISSLEETSVSFLSLASNCNFKLSLNKKTPKLVCGIWTCWLVCKRKIACEFLDSLYTKSEDTFTDIKFDVGDIKAVKGYKYLCNIIINILDKDPPHSSKILINLTKCMIKIAESASSREELYVLEDLVPASMELSGRIEDKIVIESIEKFLSIIA